MSLAFSSTQHIRVQRWPPCTVYKMTFCVLWRYIPTALYEWLKGYLNATMLLFWFYWIYMPMCTDTIYCCTACSQCKVHTLNEQDILYMYMYMYSTCTCMYSHRVTYMYTLTNTCGLVVQDVVLNLPVICTWNEMSTWLHIYM